MVVLFSSISGCELHDDNLENNRHLEIHLVRFGVFGYWPNDSQLVNEKKISPNLIFVLMRPDPQILI